jgi:hypothetical protein
MSAPPAGPGNPDAGPAAVRRGFGRALSPRAVVAAVLFAAISGLAIW